MKIKKKIIVSSADTKYFNLLSELYPSLFAEYISKVNICAKYGRIPSCNHKPFKNHPMDES